MSAHRDYLFAGAHVLFQPAGDALDNKLATVVCVPHRSEERDRYWVTPDGTQLVLEVPISRDARISTTDMKAQTQGIQRAIAELSQLGVEIPASYRDRYTWEGFDSLYFGALPPGVPADYSARPPVAQIIQATAATG